MNRRQLLLAAIAATPFAATLSARAAASSLAPGVQLYTVREELKRDFRGTLSKIAALGYKEVEFAGYHGQKPAEIRRWLDESGLTAPSAHIGQPKLEDLAQVIDDAKVLGHRYLVQPWVDQTQWRDLDGWQRRADHFNKIGERCREAGMQFCYHNHHFEFAKLSNGQTAYDLLLTRSDAKLVQMELDLFWAVVARQDPLALMRRDPARFPLVHLKQARALPWAAGADLVAQNTGDAAAVMSDVGAGLIDFPALLADPAARGVKHGFVEHDAPKDAMASLEASAKAMKGWGR